MRSFQKLGSIITQNDLRYQFNLSNINGDWISQFQNNGFVIFRNILNEKTFYPLQNIYESETYQTLYKYREQAKFYDQIQDTKNLPCFQQKELNSNSNVQVIQSFCYNKLFEGVLLSLQYKNPAFIKYIHQIQFPDKKIDNKQKKPIIKRNNIQTCHYMNSIKIVVSLSENNFDNGCIWVVPQSHKNLSINTEKENQYLIDHSIPLEVNKGSIILMHGDLLYMQYENLTKKHNHTLQLHFIDKSKSDTNCIKQQQQNCFSQVYKNYSEVTNSLILDRLRQQQQ